ncbi:MAG: EamA family transporter [Oscillospiraceae bacterium]|nr:EamA family transporter [Oscillospiraceae bacterium]
MSGEKTGAAEMLACAVLWSMAGILFKYIPWNPMVIASVRALIAGCVVWLFIRFRGMPLSVSRRTLSTGLAKGMTCLLFVVANKLTTAANAIVLQYTAPVFLMLFSAAFYHRRFSRADVTAVTLTLLGISLFFLGQFDAGKMLGNLVAVGAGVSMGAMYMFMGEVTETERLSSVLIGEIFCVLAGMPFWFLTPPALSARPVFIILILGIFQLGIPYILYSLAAGKCTPLACCLLGALEPLLNPLWVLLFYGEKPGLFALLGGAVVIATVTLWSVLPARRAAKPETEAERT